MDPQFEAEDQPLRSRTVGGRRPISLPVLLLLTVACLSALPVGFFGVCTAEIAVNEIYPGILGDSLGMVLWLAVAGGVLLSLGVFLLAVWPQWRRYLQARAQSRGLTSSQAPNPTTRPSRTASRPAPRDGVADDGSS
jgi:hypothetical protein